MSLPSFGGSSPLDEPVLLSTVRLLAALHGLAAVADRSGVGVKESYAGGEADDGAYGKGEASTGRYVERGCL